MPCSADNGQHRGLEISDRAGTEAKACRTHGAAMPLALRSALKATASVRLRFVGQWRSLPDLEQACLDEFRGEQRQLRVTVRLAFQPPHVPAVQVWRIGFSK